MLIRIFYTVQLIFRVEPDELNLKETGREIIEGALTKSSDVCSSDCLLESVEWQQTEDLEPEKGKK